jgi:hypothetical protein
MAAFIFCCFSRFRFWLHNRYVNRRKGSLFIVNPIRKQVMESVSTILASRQPLAVR